MSKKTGSKESSSSSSDDDSEVKDKPYSNSIEAAATHDKFGGHASTNSLNSAEAKKKEETAINGSLASSSMGVSLAKFSEAMKVKVKHVQ
jgi:hypothetical protein